MVPNATSVNTLVEARNLPSHVGIIMDGNGRWAQLRGSPRAEGHREGSRAVRRIVGTPEGDRPLQGPCEELARWVLSGAPQKLAEEVLTS